MVFIIVTELPYSQIECVNFSPVYSCMYTLSHGRADSEHKPYNYCFHIKYTDSQKHC